MITEIQRIVRDSYEQLYANKLGNLEKMDKFPEIYNLPRLNDDEIENLNRLIISKEIESLIKNLPTYRHPEPDGFTSEFYQIFKDELIPVLLKLFQKIEEEATLPNTLYQASITLIPKLDSNATKKLQANISDEHRSEKPEQNISKPNSTIH